MLTMTEQRNCYWAEEAAPGELRWSLCEDFVEDARALVVHEQHVWRAILQEVEHVLNKDVLVLKRKSGLTAAADCQEALTDGILVHREGVFVEHEQKENTASIA